MMRHLKYILLSFALCLLSLSSRGQVSVEARIDSMEILIGDQTRVSLEVNAASTQQVKLPELKDTLTMGVEILETLPVDTQYLNDGARMLLREDYLITSFDSALYFIPGLEVQVDGQTYKSNPLALKVYTVPVDTLNPDLYYPPKGQMAPPFVFSDWILLIVCALLIAPAAWAAWIFLRRIRENKPIIRKVKVEPKLPAHQVAINEIQHIKDEQLAQKAEPKLYYTRLVDVLRAYIAERFGIDAMEMTSQEILSGLLRFGDTEALGTLRSLFETSDLVKFAKLVPDMSEKDGNLLTALSFINKTREVEDPNAVPQPTEITVVEKPSLKSRLILYGLMGLSAVVCVGCLVCVIMEIWGLLL